MTDDDISIDFSKIKEWFKGRTQKIPHEDSTKERSDEPEELTVQFDWTACKQFLARHHVLLLLLIPLFLSAHFRLYPTDLPAMEQHAENNVHGVLRNNLAQQIAQRYPNLPPEKRNELVNEQFQDAVTQRQGEIQRTITGTAEQLKARFQDDTGQTYLIAIDPYTYYREVRNMLDHGHTGDTLKEVDGKMIPWSTKTVAPLGSPAGTQLHHYIGYYFHKLWSVLNPNVSLLTTFFYVPVLISMLAVIPAFFIARRAAGNLAGLFAGIIVAIHPVFLGRTTAGFSDTDAYNVLFPLAITWIFLLALDSKTRKEQIGYGVLAAVLVGLFASAWPGWWYIFDFLLATLGVLVLYYAVLTQGNWRRTLHELKPYILPSGIFILLSALTVMLLTSWQAFLNFLKGPFGFLFIKQAAHETLWPNVYTTVAELNAASIGQIISQSGGMLMFLIALIGIIYVLFTAWKGRTSPALAFVLTLWFIGTIYASTKGVRFILLLVPAFATAFGVGVGAIYQQATQIISEFFHLSKRWVQPVLIILLLLLLVRPYAAAEATAVQEVPSMTDVWWRGLEHIKATSPENAIITSWWDFGHWFKAVADRSVTFDGGSQNTPQAHWVGKTLLSDNEAQTIGILRMLNCGSNTAFEELQRQNNNQSITSIHTLYALFELNRDEARQELIKRGYDPVPILERTHCDPPASYYITSQDMVGKSGVWSHFGSWNFTRSKIVVATKGKRYADAIEEIERLNFTTEEATALYNQVTGKNDKQLNSWIAPWPSYINIGQQRYIAGCERQGDGVLCQNGLAVNLTNHDARLRTQEGLQPPQRLVYWNGTEITTKTYNTSQSTSAILIPRKDSYASVLAADPLAMSTFTRLFYLEGEGMEHFEKVFDDVTVNGWRVLIWKIDWNGTQDNQGFNRTA